MVPSAWLVKVGSVIAEKYVVERVLGAGGAGIVLSCRHRATGGLFALKILKTPTEEQAERLMREARLITKLKNEHVCRVFDIDRLPGGGAPFVVMEHLEGESLDSALRRAGSLPVPEAATVVLHACIALAEAHSHGIVHRDIKPANLFRTTAADGSVRIKVLDFGISKDRQNSDRLTAASAVFGSPPYMSPEQFEATGDVDGRTDVWSLGVTLYELVTGTRPFVGADVVELFTRIMTGAVVPPTAVDPTLPARLDQVIERALGKTTRERYGSVADMARDVAPLAPPEVGRAALAIIGRLTPTQEIRRRWGTTTERAPAVPLPGATTTQPLPRLRSPQGREAPVPARRLAQAAGALALAVTISAGLYAVRTRGAVSDARLVEPHERTTSGSDPARALGASELAQAAAAEAAPRTTRTPTSSGPVDPEASAPITAAPRPSLEPSTAGSRPSRLSTPTPTVPRATTTARAAAPAVSEPAPESASSASPSGPASDPFGGGRK